LLHKIETCEHDTEFFSEHDVCPSCNQDIAEQYKESIIKDLNDKLMEQNGKVGELETILSNLNEKLSGIIALYSTSAYIIEDEGVDGGLKVLPSVGNGGKYKLVVSTGNEATNVLPL
jgi:hypothetical protein